MTDTPSSKNQDAQKPSDTLSVDAKNALAEAKARRAKIDQINKDNEKEEGGRGGLDPARFGDWEVKGITSDF